MKARRSPLLFTLLLAGCVSSSASLDPSLLQEIPEGANLIVIESDRTPADLYRDIYRQLASKGFEIKEQNEDLGTISTEFNEIGRETTLAVRVFVDQQDYGSSAQLRGRWGAGQDLVLFTSMMTGANTSVMQGQPAEWKQRNRAGVAFGQLASFAKQIPHDRIRYEVE